MDEIKNLPMAVEIPQLGENATKGTVPKKKRAVREKEISEIKQQPQKSILSEVHAKDEVERIYLILSPMVCKVDEKLYADIPTKKDKKRCEVKVKSDRGDTLRNWIKEQYWKQYPNDKDPRISSFDIACGRLHREYDISEESTSKKKSESGGTSQFKALENEIYEKMDDKWRASVAGTWFVRVPYIEGSIYNSSLIGIWLLGGRQPIRLLDCHIQFVELNRPHARSKSTEYSGTILVINAKGETKRIEITREEIEEKGLDAKLKAFAIWPKSRRVKDWLLEAIDNLMREDGVTIHDQNESLGWVEHPQLGLTWLYNNGLGTANGFISSDKAPYTSPNIVSPGNGYRGMADVPAPTDDIWNLWLNKLNPSNWARVLGKLGAYARVKFPEKTVENAGTLDFAIETVGEGSGQGKSAEDNYILSLDGIDFRYDFPSYLTETDTQPGRLRPMSKVRYCLFGDYDRKARPSQTNFDKQHESRKLVVSQYADHTGGGTISSRDAQKERARGKPCGGILLTGNYDHVPTSVEREEEATEYRVCTFLVDVEEKADRNISQQIDARRVELFSWGHAFKLWIMQRFNQDSQAFALHIQGLRVKAETLVSEGGYNWPHHRYQNQCVDLVWGICAWKSFLEECYPNSLLLQWLDVLVSAFIEERYQRASYVQAQVDNRKSATTLDQFVLETVRGLLGTSQCYIASQQNQNLSPEEIPMSPSDFGLVRKVFEDKEEWVPGRTLIGYYLSRKGAIAFIPHLFYQEVAREATRRKFPIPGEQDFKKQLAEAGITTVKRDKEGEIIRPDFQEKINGDGKWCLTIPLAILYPQPDPSEVEDEEEEEYMQAADEATNVTPLHKKRPNPVEERPDDEIVTSDLF